ncbi:MAG: TetR family transcriptional regulator, partial [Polyangiales bacterium]
DKRALLDAVAQDGLATYVAQKALHAPHPDPVQDLRVGWDTHVAFGLAHPELFAILAGDVQPRPLTPSAAAGLDVLQRRIRNIALAGRLRVSEARALGLIEAACTGAVLTLLRTPLTRRDLGLSEAAREAVIAAITTEPLALSDQGARGAASALRGALDDTRVLSAGERHLLTELLERIADGSPKADGS